MIDKELTEWLYYEHIYKYATGKSKFDDPKYVSMLPNQDKFETFIINCNTNEFLTTIVELFREEYPENFSYIRAMLTWDKTKEKCFEGKVFRKKKDITEMHFIQDEDYYNLEKVTLKFQQAQPESKVWVEKGLEGKIFTHSQQGEFNIYKLENQLIDKIEVNSIEFKLYVNPEKAPR